MVALKSITALTAAQGVNKPSPECHVAVIWPWPDGGMLNRVTNLLRAQPGGTTRQPSGASLWPAGQDACSSPETPADSGRPPRHHRTLWISDIHLGTAGCQARYLLDFLKHNESDTLYLVGDIIDGWQLRRGWYWPQSHNDVVQKLLRKARKPTTGFLRQAQDEQSAVNPFALSLSKGCTALAVKGANDRLPSTSPG